MTDDIIIAEDFGESDITVAEAVCIDDADILPRVGEPAAGENRALAEFADD